MGRENIIEALKSEDMQSDKIKNAFYTWPWREIFIGYILGTLFAITASSLFAQTKIENQLNLKDEFLEKRLNLETVEERVDTNSDYILYRLESIEGKLNYLIANLQK